MSLIAALVSKAIANIIVLAILALLAVILFSLIGLGCAVLFFVLCYIVTKELFINRPL